MTALQQVTFGAASDGSQGDNIRAAFTKVNDNIEILATQAPLTSVPTIVTATTSLGVGNVGQRINFNLSVAGTAYMPSAANCPADGVMLLRNLGSVPVTLAPALDIADDVCVLPALGPYESALLDVDGIHTWGVLLRARASANNEQVAGDLTVKEGLTVIGTTALAATTVPTVDASDNSENAASTEYVTDAVTTAGTAMMTVIAASASAAVATAGTNAAAAIAAAQEADAQAAQEADAQAAQATQTAIATAVAVFSGKNRIINGACQVAQRPATVFAMGVQGYGGPDRYFAVNNSSTASQFTQSQGTITYEGVTHDAVVQTVNTALSVTSGASYWLGFTQIIESAYCYDLQGQPVALSFLFNSNVGGVFSVALRSASGTYYWVTTFSAQANTPIKVSIPITEIPAALAIPNSTIGGLDVTIGAIHTGTYATSTLNAWEPGNIIGATTATNWGAAVGNYIALTELQLEAQEQTAFEREHIQSTWLKCRRYRRQNAAATTSLVGNAVFTGNVTAGSAYYADIGFDMPMRVAPSVTVSSNAATAFNLGNASYVQGPDVWGFVLSNAATGTGNGSYFYGWAADAEL